MKDILTARQWGFIGAFARLGDPRQAALAAGYAPSTAAKAGVRLLAHPAIRQELERLFPRVPEVPTDDPVKFLATLMADRLLPLHVRLRAAVAAARYTSARPISASVVPFKKPLK